MSTLIQTNQYNIDKQNLEEKIDDIVNKVPQNCGLVTTAVLNTKISNVGKKIPDVNGLVTTIALHIKLENLRTK